jgi:chemotaxis protein CheD
MKPFDNKLPVVYLKPGELYISNEPAAVSTVLGSCVSITLFHRQLKLGAICHGLLPKCKHAKNRGCHKTCKDLDKYVDCAFIHMKQQFLSYSMNKDEIEVKLFGGAEILLLHDHTKGITSVGEKNIKVATQLIKAEGFKIIASSTGGTKGRKLFFLPHTGDIYVKHLRQAEDIEGQNRRAG